LNGAAREVILKQINALKKISDPMVLPQNQAWFAWPPAAPFGLTASRATYTSL
jgi:hypothetical protein